MLSVREAAAILGVSPQRVRAMCAGKEIAAQKKGRDWIISERALAKAQRERRKPGRPKDS